MDCFRYKDKKARIERVKLVVTSTVSLVLLISLPLVDIAGDGTSWELEVTRIIDMFSRVPGGPSWEFEGPPRSDSTLVATCCILFPASTSTPVTTA
jgi:hypothetical protein